MAAVLAGAYEGGKLPEIPAGGTEVAIAK